MAVSTANPPPAVVLIDWTPRSGRTLRGFASVRVGRGMILRDLSVHVGDGKRWVGMPGKPIVGRDGSVHRDAAGKVKYTPIVEWTDREAADRFRHAVLAAVEAEHPEALA